MAALESLGISVSIWTTPTEVPESNSLRADREHASDDPEYANRFWRILVETSRVLKEFRSRFIGKVSPIRFFGEASISLSPAFQDVRAPAHPGTSIRGPFCRCVKLYSHEVSSCGLWPGGGPVNGPVFYAYAYPEPNGFKDYQVQPSEAFYHTGMGDFMLPYDVVRTAKSPDDVLLSFLQGTYEAAAICGNWDRQALERQ